MAGASRQDVGSCCSLAGQGAGAEPTEGHPAPQTLLLPLMPPSGGPSAVAFLRHWGGEGMSRSGHPNPPLQSPSETGDRHYPHFTKEEAEARDLTPYKIQSSQRSAVCLFPLDKGLPRPGPQTWEGPQRPGGSPGQRQIHPLSLRGSLGCLDLGEGVPQVSQSPGDQECWVGVRAAPGFRPVEPCPWAGFSAPPRMSSEA